MAKVENTAGFENITTSKPEIDSEAAAISIAKPGAFNLNKFKSKRAAAIANVETLLTALPHHSISQAKDFVRLHPDEATFARAVLRQCAGQGSKARHVAPDR